MKDTLIKNNDPSAPDEASEPRATEPSPNSLAKQIIDDFCRRSWTLALAESCTGGLVSKILTDIEGASGAFVLAVVSYANQAKTKVLGVAPEILQKHGAVSEACARAMAEGARRLSGATVALAVTGIAGPTGGTPEKPVGTVFFAVAGPQGTMVSKSNFPPQATRQAIRQLAAQTALTLIRHYYL